MKSIESDAMTRNEVLRGLKALVGFHLANCPNLDDAKEANTLVSLWDMLLKSYDYEAYKLAILLYVKSNTFFPAPAQILERMQTNDAYANPMTIYKLFMNEDHNDELIKKAFKDCGYTRYDLKQLDVKTIENRIKPKVESYYKDLVEKEKLKDDMKQLTNNQKMIGG